MSQQNHHTDDVEYDDFDCFCVGDAVREYHEHTGQPISPKPRRLPKDRIELRLGIIDEELEELKTSLLHKNNVVSVVWGAQSLANLVIAIVGIATEMGLPFDSIFEEVHRSNMTIPNDDEYGYVDKNGNVKRPQVGIPPELLPIIREAM